PRSPRSGRGVCLPRARSLRPLCVAVPAQGSPGEIRQATAAGRHVAGALHRRAGREIARAAVLALGRDRGCRRPGAEDGLAIGSRQTEGHSFDGEEADRGGEDDGQEEETPEGPEEGGGEGERTPKRRGSGGRGGEVREGGKEGQEEEEPRVVSGPGSGRAAEGGGTCRLARGRASSSATPPPVRRPPAASRRRSRAPASTSGSTTRTSGSGLCCGTSSTRPSGRATRWCSCG